MFIPPDMPKTAIRIQHTVFSNSRFLIDHIYDEYAACKDKFAA